MLRKSFDQTEMNALFLIINFLSVSSVCGAGDVAGDADSLLRWKRQVPSSFRDEIHSNDARIVNLGHELYLFDFDNPRTWMDAKMYCSRWRMELVSLDSKEENDRVVGYILQKDKADQNYWTSGRRNSRTNLWFWTGIFKPLTFMAWVQGLPPRGETGNCLMLSQRGDLAWENALCDSAKVKASSICERRRSPYLDVDGQLQSGLRSVEVEVPVMTTTEALEEEEQEEEEEETPGESTPTQTDEEEVMTKSRGSQKKNTKLLTLDNDEYILDLGAKLNWRDARDACEKMEAFLVSPDTKTKMELVVQAIRDTGKEDVSYWTGGYLSEEEDTDHWRWASEVERPVTGYTDWAPGRPTLQKCLRLWWKEGFAWDDYCCSGRFHFICEKKRVVKDIQKLMSECPDKDRGEGDDEAGEDEETLQKKLSRGHFQMQDTNDDEKRSPTQQGFRGDHSLASLGVREHHHRDGGRRSHSDHV